MSERAAVKLELPDDVLRPGQLVQIQKAFGDRQIEVSLEQIVNAEMLNDMLPGETARRRFQNTVIYHTLSGLTLSYDRKDNNWWLLIKKSFDQKHADPIPVDVFLI